MTNCQFQKHFTIDEARSLLPFLRKQLKEMARIHSELAQTGFDVYRGKYRPGFHPDTLEPYPRLYHRFLHLAREILDMGIQIKSFESGLVDFPALRPNGEEVFLCWKTDEEDIRFWHGLKAGFKGRRPLDSF